MGNHQSISESRQEPDVFSKMYGLVPNATDLGSIDVSVKMIIRTLFCANEVEYHPDDLRFYVKPEHEYPKGKRQLALDLGGRCGWTLLGASAMRNNLELANWLLVQGANIHNGNEFGHTPLYIACDYGNLDMVKFLIKMGADPLRSVTMWSGDTERGSTSVGITPMMIAVKRGYTEIVDYLNLIIKGF